MTAPKRAVYTALMGSYEELGDQPIAATSSVPFICFTDNPTLRSASWDVRVVEPALPADSVRSARALKIRGHDALSGFDETLWIDNTVLLRKDPDELLDDWLSDTDFALPRHSFRGTVAAEFDAVVQAGLDDRARVYEQLNAYGSLSPEELTREALWTAILARRSTTQTKETMRIWLDNVLRYSRRDQLSIAFAIAASGQTVRTIDIDNWGSPWHEWPIALKRQSKPRANGGRHDRSSSSAAELAGLLASVDDLTASYNRSIEARETALKLIEGSRTWRWTQPVRHLLAVGRGVRARAMRR